MVGFFSDLSDTDDSAIDEIISQAKDATVLEQVSAINCSSFTDDSLLPTHLESRFRKLKSFPAAAAAAVAPPPGDSKGGNFAAFNSRSFHHPVKGHEKNPQFSPPDENPDGKTGSNPKLERGFVSSPSDSAHGKIELKSKSKSKFSSVSPDSASGSSRGSEESSLSSMFKPAQKERVKSGSPPSSSQSPPRRAGCFWCSPKKKDSMRKKKSEDWGVLGWDKSDNEFLSDLRSLSSKEQQKIMKKAMKEEEKIIREAEKIVEMAMHASARMNVTGIEDELSSDEDY